MSGDMNRRWTDLTVILLLGGIVLSLAWFYRDFAQDDAFITYRYAQNIAAGRGFVYNPGEPVLGTTTPLYTLVLALLGKVSGQEIRLIGHLVSVISLWLAGATLYLLGRDYHRLMAAAAALVFTSNPLLISAIGMETFFLLALLLLALQYFIAGKYLTSGVLLGCLALTRYELLIFGGLLGLYFLIKQRRLPLWLILTAVLFAAWLGFAWSMFGQVIPNSALAKLAKSEGYSFATGAIIWWLVYTNYSAWYYLFLPVVLLGGYATLKDPNLPLAYWLILLWSSIYFVVASLTAGSFSWYYGPLIPGLSILLIWGLAFLIRALRGVAVKLQKDRTPALFSPFPSRKAAGIWGLTILGLVALQYSSTMTGWTIYEGEIIDVRRVIYGEVATWLNQHQAQGKRLAVEEVGVLGYYTEMEIIDLRGLVTPALIPAIRRSRLETLHRALALYEPDYLLTHESDYLEAMPAFPDYKPVQSFGNNHYILYEKQLVEGRNESVKAEK